MRITALVVLVVTLAASAFTDAAVSLSPLDSAKALSGQGRYADAVLILDQIVAPDQEASAQALDLMARCYGEIEKWSKAIECLRKLEAMRPASPALTEIKLRLADYYLADGKLEEYQALRQELLSRYPDEAWRLHYVVGKRRVLRHEYAEAIPELTKAVGLCSVSKSDADVLDANYRLLHCYVVRKEWGRVEEMGARLIEAYPSDAYRFQMEVGKCYQVRGKYDKAIEYLDPAAEKCPKGFDNAKRLFKTLMDCYDMMGHFDRAIALGKKLVQDYPDEPGYKWELGRAYVYAQEYDRAAPLFEKVMATSKADWEIRSSQIFYGQCTVQLGKGHEALERIEAYYNDKPELWDSRLLAKAGVLFYGMNDSEGCVNTLRQLLDRAAAGEKTSLVSTARELMLRGLERMEGSATAAALLEKMAMESDDPRLMYKAGRAYYCAKQVREASRIYKALLHRTGLPDDVRALAMHGLGLCYWDGGFKSAARRLVSKVQERFPDSPVAVYARESLESWQAAGK